jgi:hypothetical protein
MPPGALNPSKHRPLIDEFLNEIDPEPSLATVRSNSPASDLRLADLRGTQTCNLLSGTKLGIPATPLSGLDEGETGGFSPPLATIYKCVYSGRNAVLPVWANRPSALHVIERTVDSTVSRLSLLARANRGRQPYFRLIVGSQRRRIRTVNHAGDHLLRAAIGARDLHEHSDVLRLASLPRR